MELSFFPTPYPDETIYSVICRLWRRMGRPSYHYLGEKLIGRQLSLNPYAPHGIGRIIAHIPENTGLTGDYLVNKTTMFPYFAPFLSEERRNLFLGYMSDENVLKNTAAVSLGLVRLRYPKHLYLRFCESCWNENIQIYGEPYWHRVHQLPGVLICSHHEEPLLDSPILVSQANLDFYAACVEMVSESSICGNFSGEIAEKLLRLSQNSYWLLENGHKYEPYEQTHQLYDMWLRSTGYSSLNGRVWHNKIFQRVNELYGEEFLRLIDAYDKDETVAWARRLLLSQSKLQHPMYHILLHILLAGSTIEFFNGDCQKPLPYGESPWPCRNPICQYNLQDVIENVDMKYDKGLYRAVFECPHCGFTYKRKQPIPKEKQYAGTVYIASYGYLWEQKLKEYIVAQGLSAKRAAELLCCDTYTVQKYALRLGYMNPADAPAYVKKNASKAPQHEKPVLNESDERKMWRKTWMQLISDNPNANRSRLKALAPACYKWLMENDPAWLEKHLPANQQTTYCDWGTRDTEYLERIKEAVDDLHNAEGKPVWVSLHRIALQTGLHAIRNKKSLSRMPKTATFLQENIESIGQWRKRKIIWAIRYLRENEKTVTPFQIGFTATINSQVALGFHDYMQECLEKEEKPERV